MKPPSKEILTTITPHLEKIRQCIALAWKDYNTECEHIRHKTTPTTRAGIVRDNIVYHVKKMFGDIKEVDFLQRGQLFLLIINNKICIKFKKLNGHMLPSYIPTQRALSYMDQNQTEIEGIPQASKWVAGYRLDSLQISVKNILITYPMGAKQAPWHLELTPVIEQIIVPLKEEKRREINNE